jgi:hypothetical protein
MDMSKLPDSAHLEHPWRIHELLPDFRLEDVWALPTPGAADDFPVLIQGGVEMDPAKGSSAAARSLFALRWKLGELFGWDDAEGDGPPEPSLRDRLPADLRDGPRGPEFEALPFSPLYLLEDEYAAELANRTMHGVMHLGWVRDGDRYRGQMAVYVKPNGLAGEAYMAAIRPFRHLVVYPPMIRDFDRQWRHRVLEGDPAELAALKREWRERY